MELVSGGIMFNGCKLKNVVVFKKDVVLHIRSRMNGFHVCVGAPQRFIKQTDNDLNRRFF